MQEKSLATTGVVRDNAVNPTSEILSGLYFASRSTYSNRGAWPCLGVYHFSPPRKRTHPLNLTVLIGKTMSFLKSAYNQSIQKKKRARLSFQVAPVGVEILSGLRLLPGFPRE